MFWAEILKISEFFNLKIFGFGWWHFNIFEKACFRNGCLLWFSDAFQNSNRRMIYEQPTTMLWQLQKVIFSLALHTEEEICKVLSWFNANLFVVTAFYAQQVLFRSIAFEYCRYIWGRFCNTFRLFKFSEIFSIFSCEASIIKTSREKYKMFSKIKIQNKKALLL